MDLYGILGFPLTHSCSPEMQEAAFQSKQKNARYIKLELDASKAKRFLNGLSKSDIQGLNVTVPYKQLAYKSLKRLDPAARACKAVNTIYRDRNGWKGANTDVEGFLWPLKQAKVKLRGKRVCLIGAGGAARAVLYGLGSQKVGHIILCNRTISKAESLEREFQTLFPKINFETRSVQKEDLLAVILESDLIINSTSLGLKKGDAKIASIKEIPKAKVSGRKIFYDLIYNPAKTPFLEVAEKQGHRIINGLEMLVIQGARAWELWTGQKPPVNVMHKKLVEVVKRTA